MSRFWNPGQNAAREHFGQKDFDNLGRDSKILASRLPPCSQNMGEPLTVPIYHSSVYRNTSVQQYLDIVQHGGYIYQRLGNPTTETAEVLINELEGGQGTIVYNSGLAAMNAVFLNFLSQGDHIVCQNPCYSGTQDFIQRILTKFGVTVTWVLGGSPISAFQAAIRPDTKMIYAESPSNPTMSLVDLEALGKLSSGDIVTVVDSTFASPYLVQPIKHGVDVSLHSCSKYMGGHSDLIGGCLTFRSLKHWKEHKVLLGSTGSTMSALDASLLIRGLKSLPVRIERHSYNAMELASYLEEHPKVRKVWYPGLKSHPQHDIAKDQLLSFGGMISFEMEDLTAAKSVVENLRLINLAVSLGGAESLMEHPASMTHGPLFCTEESSETPTISDGLIRFSVGLENVDDLKSDLERALSFA